VAENLKHGPSALRAQITANFKGPINREKPPFLI